MALPPGITPKTVTLGIASFADGSLASGRATISMPVNVLHTPTNRPIFSSEITKPFVDGEVTFDLLPTDSAGLNRVDWSYKLKVEIQGATVQPEVIYFLLPTAGPDVVDLDGLVTVPSSAGIPIAVDVLTVADVNDPATTGGAALRAASVAAVEDSGEFAAADAALAIPGDVILYVRPGGSDSNDGLSWKTAKQTLAAAITALPTGGVIEIAGQHTIATSLPQPADHTLIRGRSSKTRISWTGTGHMVELTNARQIHWENLRITATAAGQTLFYLFNSFRCSWSRCVIDGQHSGTSGSTYYSQVGLQFRGNTGDSRIVNCDLNNLGEAIQTDTIMNYLVASVVGNCYTGVHVDAGASTGGMAIDNCTFVGTAIGAAAVRAHVLIEVAANQTWITNSWFEGCTVAVQAGKSGVGGPVGMVIANCRLAATSKCLDIQHGRQFRLDMVRFSADLGGATPVELSIDATNAPDGFASGLLSSTNFDVARTAFPPNWTFLSRSQSESQMAATTLYVGQGVSAGTPSYIYTGNGRVRVGYDGARTVLSDAGGDRDVAILSGTTPPRQVVVSKDGYLYVGAKAQGTQNAGGGVIGVYIQNAATLPTSNPAGGGILYVDNGALKYRGPNGTVTTIGPA